VVDVDTLDLEMVVLYFVAEFQKRVGTNHAYPTRIDSAIRNRLPTLGRRNGLLPDVIAAAGRLVKRGELEPLMERADVPDAIREYQLTELGARRLGDFQLPREVRAAHAGLA